MRKAGPHHPVDMNMVFQQHLKMGHANMEVVFDVLGIKNAEALLTARNLCTSCLMGKLPNLSQKSIKEIKAPRANYRQFADTCGPFCPSYQDGFRFFQYIVDEFTDYSEVFFCKNRSEWENIVKYHIGNSNARHHPLKLVELRMDGAPEFHSKRITEWYKGEYLQPLKGLPYSSHHQYKAERGLRHVQELEKSMRHYAGLSPEFWPYAIKQANNVRVMIPKGQSPDGSRGWTPWELHHRATEKVSLKTLLQHLHEFGALCVFHRPKQTRRKGRGDFNGSMGIYLCSNGPNRGHCLIRLSDQKVLDNVRTIKIRKGVFPLREAREADLNSLYNQLSFKSIELDGGGEHRESNDDSSATDLSESDSSCSDAEAEAEGADPIQGGINAHDPLKLKSCLRLASKHSQAKAISFEESTEVLKDKSVEYKTTSSPTRYNWQAGDEAMSASGVVLVDKVYPDGDLRVSWPHSQDPLSYYTITPNITTLWKKDDYPRECYDSDGNNIPLSQVKGAHEISSTSHRLCAYQPSYADALATHSHGGGHKSIRSTLGLRDGVSLIGHALADAVEEIMPRTATQERKCTDSEILELIKQAKVREWQTLRNKGCYSELMQLPKGKIALRHVWVLRAKPDGNGMLSKIKARCALQGNKEKLEIPRMDAYAPVMYAHTLRVLLAHHINDPSVTFYQLDVTAAYISAHMRREVYVYPPDEFRSQHSYYKVHRVLRALYGGIDSGRIYYEHWMDFHLKLGFQPIHHDKCYMHLRRPNGSFIRFCFHVDDGAYASKDKDLWQWYLKKLSAAFDYTTGPLEWCLGIRFHIDYANGSIFMEQSAKVDQALRNMSLDDKLKSVETPAACGRALPNPKGRIRHSAEEQAKGQCFQMLKALGILNALHCCTRPDIGHALRAASKYGYEFNDDIVAYVKRIFRYLRGTKHLGLTYRRVGGPSKTLEPSLLQIFTDASHASDPLTYRSTSALVIKLGGNTVFWKVSFQSIVSHSSTESELMALDKGATVGQFIKWICAAVGARVRKPITIFIDNTATITMSVNPVQPGRNMHIHARFFYVRDFVAEGEYILSHLRTDHQLADVLATFKSTHTFLRLRTYLMGCAYVMNNASNENVWVDTYL